MSLLRGQGGIGCRGASGGLGRRAVTVALGGMVLALALAVGAAARTSAAGPPANDDRANAEVIPTFPATVEGTTVGATVERLDPQRSRCGTVESTVWYRINQAPDGTIELAVRGAGLAPVVRIYNLAASSIVELDCASAKVGAAARVAWETRRGASYLVLVGKRAGTADAPFELTAQLYLPPTNDSVREARPLQVPGHVKATTFGATSDPSDPQACGLAGGTVWYSLAPGKANRVVLRLHAEGDLDATAVVVRRSRSQTEQLACSPTDRRGDAVIAWDVARGVTYLVAVGQRKGSNPGDFTLQALAAQPRERAPGVRLPAGGVASTVDWLTDVNDVWWTTFRPGTTYRLAFSSPGCPTLTLRGRVGLLRSFACNGYTTFTPGPDGGGRYVLEVTAPPRTGAVAYRLRVARATADDVGVGLELANLATRRGTLAPADGDVVDLFHFDVPALSDVRIRLAQPVAHPFELQLLTYGGSSLGYSDRQLRRTLQPGHYVLAVRARPGGPAGAYRVSLLIRGVTATTLTASSAEVAPGTRVAFDVRVAPRPEGGWIKLQIDRFDSLGGWQFNRMIRVRAPGGAVGWTPPAPGRWRARASFLGTVRFSPSRSGYSEVLVTKPLG